MTADSPREQSGRPGTFPTPITERAAPGPALIGVALLSVLGNAVLQRTVFFVVTGRTQQLVGDAVTLLLGLIVPLAAFLIALVVGPDRQRRPAAVTLAVVSAMVFGAGSVAHGLVGLAAAGLGSTGLAAAWCLALRGRQLRWLLLVVPVVAGAAVVLLYALVARVLPLSPADAVLLREVRATALTLGPLVAAGVVVLVSSCRRSTARSRTAAGP